MISFDLNFGYSNLSKSTQLFVMSLNLT